MNRPELTLVSHFSSIPDYRENHNKRHILVEIIVMAVCCTICGANAFTEIAVIANAKKDWFQSFLTLPSGIPSHDTFNRVLARVNPKALQSCFNSFKRAAAFTRAGELKRAARMETTLQPGGANDCSVVMLGFLMR